VTTNEQLKQKRSYSNVLVIDRCPFHI
jgi:hypothetical protein